MRKPTTPLCACWTAAIGSDTSPKPSQSPDIRKTVNSELCLPHSSEFLLAREQQIFERATDAQRPGGVLRGGRLEIGVRRRAFGGSRIDFAVSASPKPVLSYLSCRAQERYPPEAPEVEACKHANRYPKNGSSRAPTPTVLLPMFCGQLGTGRAFVIPWPGSGAWAWRRWTAP